MEVGFWGGGQGEAGRQGAPQFSVSDLAEYTGGGSITKHLDVTAGAFYYVDTESSETSWDKPAGVEPPLILALPSSEEQEEDWT
jgi:hypothetical protein